MDALVSEQRRTVTLYEHLFQAEDGRPFQVELRPVNAADLLSQAAGFKTREALEKKNISLVLQAPPDLSVLGNPDVLGIVLDNLLGNAGKYTPQGGRILLAASRFPRGRLATISVSDSGIGLSAEDQALVLSAEGGRTEAAKKMASGDGLGLPAVAAFLGANGSALRLLSVPRAGSTFFFRLTTIR
ncbi:MAG: hypothetical protein KGK30_02525 [Elusimicrobia bacterium]|nr:hypothetical protein [Elusimicrobiota bacterium]